MRRAWWWKAASWRNNRPEKHPHAHKERQIAMRVSTRVEYGMVALTDIALYSEHGSSVSAPDIAERQHISQKYLEQILTHLKQAGLIRAQKGLKGGYALSRPADDIRLSDVLNALDTGILAEQDASGEAYGLRGAVNACLWQKLNRGLTEFAESKTLSEFVQECKNQTTDSWDLYVI